MGVCLKCGTCHVEHAALRDDGREPQTHCGEGKQLAAACAVGPHSCGSAELKSCVGVDAGWWCASGLTVMGSRGGGDDGSSGTRRARPGAI